MCPVCRDIRMAFERQPNGLWLCGGCGCLVTAKELDAVNEGRGP
jgi:hypothetical protein